MNGLRYIAYNGASLCLIHYAHKLVQLDHFDQLKAIYWQEMTYELIKITKLNIYVHSAYIWECDAMRAI